MIPALGRNTTCLVLIASALTTFAACRTTEEPSWKYMPGYRIKYPTDLPQSEVRRKWKGNGGSKAPGPNAPEEEFENVIIGRSQLREEYAEAHANGWRNCFHGYRWGEISLSQDYSETEPSTNDSAQFSLRERGRRDGYEECRRLLLENGNR